MSGSRPTWDDTWLTVAEVIALRSLCSRDQVGAVVVSASNRIIDTGYNGPPRNHWQSRNDEPCIKWCSRAIANAFYEGAIDDLPPHITLPASYDNCDSLHAEANALMFGDRTQREGGTIYTTSTVCGGCAKLIANSGLVRVVYAATSAAHRNGDKWVAFMEQCGLEVVAVT